MHYQQIGESRKELLRKFAALIATGLLIIVINLQKLQPLLRESATLDPNWVTSPAYLLLHDGKILGRDLIFTYGPLFQLISTFGATLHTSTSSIYSFHLIQLVHDQLALFLIIVSLLLIPFLRPWQAILMLIVSGPVVELRIAFLILTVTILSSGLSKPLRRTRFFYAFLAGSIAFLAQLYAFEIGVYAITLSIGLYALNSLLSWVSNKNLRGTNQHYWPIKEYLLISLTMISVFLILNFFTSLIFLNSSASYQFLLQYQILSMNLATGYVYLMGLPIDPILWPAISMFLLIWIFLFGVILLRYKQLNPVEAQYHLGFLAVATLLIKSAATRSDYEHLMIGFQGIVFFLPFAIARLSESYSTRIRRVLLFTILGVVVFFNPVYWQGIVFIYDFGNILNRTSPVKNFLQARDFLPDDEEVKMVFYQLPAGYQYEDQIVLLGFRNYVAEMNNMELIAPVLQDYAINTPVLEDYAIRTIEKYNQPIILMDYGTQVDAVFSGTRYPRLFRYLLENYHISDIGNVDFEHQALVLEKRSFPNIIEEVGLPFTFNGKSIKLESGFDCGLIGLSLSIDYPKLPLIFGTPGRLSVTYFNHGEVYSDREYAIGALERGSRFSVVIPTLLEEDLWEFFYNEYNGYSGVLPMITGIEIGIWNQEFNDPILVYPSYSIHQVSCIYP